MLTIITMVVAGIVAGYGLEALIVPLALEPYRRFDRDSNESLPLRGGLGGSRLPSILTTQSILRTGAILLTTGAAFALVGLRYRGDESHLIIVATYALVLITCSATDMLAFRVPNAITYPAVVLAIVVGSVMPEANSFDVVAGGLLFGGILLIISLLASGAIGMGSAKLAFFVGFALGLTLVVRAMLITTFCSVVIIGVLFMTGIRRRGDSMPYAPIIAVAALLTLLLWGYCISKDLGVPSFPTGVVQVRRSMGVVHLDRTAAQDETLLYAVCGMNGRRTPTS